MTEIDDDVPLTLNDACEIIFKGAIGPDTLRAEARRGRLVIERIGRRDFVTRAAIREMRRKCELDLSPKGHASGSSPNAVDRAARSPRPSGSSAMTEASNVALASLLLNAQALKSNSPSTSPKPTRPRKGTLIPLKR